MCSATSHTLHHNDHHLGCSCCAAQHSLLHAPACQSRAGAKRVRVRLCCCRRHMLSSLLCWCCHACCATTKKRRRSHPTTHTHTYTHMPCHTQKAQLTVKHAPPLKRPHKCSSNQIRVIMAFKRVPVGGSVGRSVIHTCSSHKCYAPGKMLKPPHARTPTHHAVTKRQNEYRSPTKN